MSITTTAATWTRLSATPTGVSALGKQTFGAASGYPKTVAGVFYPDRKAALPNAQAPGFLIDHDATYSSDTFHDGKEGDAVTIAGEQFNVVGAAGFTLPFGPGMSHTEYALKRTAKKT